MIKYGFRNVYSISIYQQKTEARRIQLGICKREQSRYEYLILFEGRNIWKLR